MEIMRKLLKMFIIWFAIQVFFYVLMSFALMDINAVNWSLSNRGSLCVGAFFSMVLVVIISQND